MFVDDVKFTNTVILGVDSVDGAWVVEALPVCVDVLVGELVIVEVDETDKL